MDFWKLDKSKKDLFYLRLFGLFVVVLVLCSLSSFVRAAYERYSLGDTAVIGDFVYDDDFVATTTANCSITIYNPSGTLMVNAGAMTSNSNGWTYYSYSISSSGQEGVWPAYMTCGSVLSGDLVRQDKTFVVGTTLVSSTTVANAVWNSASRSLTNFGSLVSDVWSNGSRTLTSGLITVADVWSYGSRSITDATLTSGSLATLSDVQSASSSLNSALISAQTSINSNTNTQINSASSSLGSTISQASSSLNSVISGTIDAASSSIASAISSATSSLNSVLGNTLNTASTSIGSAITSAQTNINSNTNTQVNTASSSLGSAINNASSSLNVAINSAVTTINSNLAATVLTASTSLYSTIPTAVWGSTSRTLSTFGTLASDIWSNGTRTLTSGMSSLTAADVWTYSSRNLTDATLTSGSLATLSDVQSASSSLNSALISAQTSINSNTNTQINSASSSLASTISSLPATIWAYANRTLTSASNIASDIWSAATRSLTTSSTGVSVWALSTSDFDTVTAGGNYLATIFLTQDGKLTDSANLPTVTIYDPSRNVVVNGANMTRASTGTYTYSYTTSSGASAGNWETVFNVVPDNGVNLSGNDYWTISSSPAQVLINSMASLNIPNISSNITITNEGLTGYEYQYEWCVVSDLNNSCGGGDDIYHATAAKYINPGEDFNTTLTATVPNAGNYYFKVVVYFGTDSSVASRSFTAVSAGSGGGSGGGGGGGGGSSGGSSSSASPAIAQDTNCLLVGDFNCDGKVNSIDFSILLFYWKRKGEITNKKVDINKDGRVDSIDFSIFLYNLKKK